MQLHTQPCSQGSRSKGGNYPSWGWSRLPKIWVVNIIWPMGGDILVITHKYSMANVGGAWVMIHLEFHILYI